MEKPTRNISEYTMRFDLPRSFIIKNSAEPRLARIRMKAMATTMCMNSADKVVAAIISPRAADCVIPHRDCAPRAAAGPRRADQNQGASC